MKIDKERFIKYLDKHIDAVYDKWKENSQDDDVIEYQGQIDILETMKEDINNDDWEPWIEQFNFDNAMLDLKQLEQSLEEYKIIEVYLNKELHKLELPNMLWGLEANQYIEENKFLNSKIELNKLIMKQLTKLIERKK